MKNKLTLNLLVVTVILISFAGYNFIRAYDESVWFPPAGYPPTRNVATPINVGTSSQEKLGDLMIDGDVTTGNLSVTGSQAITSVNPKIWLNETDAQPWWINASNNSLYFQSDRNSDGLTTNEQPWPMKLFAGTVPADDYVQFSNKVRATQYCDAAGNNCSTPGVYTGGIQSLHYDGTVSVNSGIQSSATCMLNGMDNGGCDTGFKCKISPQGSTWQVDQTNSGDCDRTPSCDYTCTNVTNVCTVRFDSEIKNEAKTAVLSSASKTILIPKGDTSWLGGWVECNSYTHNADFTDVLLYDTPSNASQIGWWTDADYQGVKAAYGNITWHGAPKSFKAAPGVVESMNMWNGCAHVFPKVTATVVSCM